MLTQSEITQEATAKAIANIEDIQSKTTDPLRLAQAICIKNLVEGSLLPCQVISIRLEPSPISYVYKIVPESQGTDHPNGMTIYLGDYTIRCLKLDIMLAQFAIAEYVTTSALNAKLPSK